MRDRWENLPESARRALLYLADRFGSGWSGKIEIVVHEGGVRDMQEIAKPNWRAHESDEAA